MKNYFRLFVLFCLTIHCFGFCIPTLSTSFKHSSVVFEGELLHLSEGEFWANNGYVDFATYKVNKVYKGDICPDDLVSILYNISDEMNAELTLYEDFIVFAQESRDDYSFVSIYYDEGECSMTRLRSYFDSTDSEGYFNTLAEINCISKISTYERDLKNAFLEKSKVQNRSHSSSVSKLKNSFLLITLFAAVVFLVVKLKSNRVD